VEVDIMQVAVVAAVLEEQAEVALQVLILLHQTLLVIQVVVVVQ
jgi:hypothetical protein